MAYFTNSQRYFFLCSGIPFEGTGFSRLYKKIGIAFIVPIKAIPLKVFGRWGAGKITFFQKGVFLAKPFRNSLCFLSTFSGARRRWKKSTKIIWRQASASRRSKPRQYTWHIRMNAEYLHNRRGRSSRGWGYNRRRSLHRRCSYRGR